ncbi:MAG: TerB family tellurite resistance protein [Proteobacteria bacterium]|nr:TerB family tellurite resistance protein [Pseudomonadota bacterium]
MSVWGKIIGGAAGFAIGGPLGALLGASVGHAVDSGLVGAAGRAGEGATRKITFTIGVIALSAKMAKADGQVTRDEIEAFREVFKIPPHEVRNVGRVFDMARKDTAGYEAYAAQIARLFKETPQVLEDLLGALFHIANADGIMHPAEIEYLDNVARIFGFSDAQYESIRALHMGPDRASPYTIMGISPDISDKDLKKRYRTLIKENHPDKLIAQGMPQEFIEVANDRLAAINAAYDRLEEQRGLK